MQADKEQPTRRPPRRTRGKPTDVDAHVGRRIRQRRTLLGMSQEKLAEALDLTFQQVQKYERGTNRVGAGRLYQLAQALDVPIAYFFEGLGEAIEGAEATGPEQDLLSRRESLALIRAYYGISDPAVRRRLRELMKALGNGGDLASEIGETFP